MQFLLTESHTNSEAVLLYFLPSDLVCSGNKFTIVHFYNALDVEYKVVRNPNNKTIPLI